MIKLEIQLISKPEMTFKEMVDYIATDFPGEGKRVLSQNDTILLLSELIRVRSDPEAGIVSLELNQEKLSDAQRDWLHLSAFAARYIDEYDVKQLVVPEKSVTEMSYGELRHRAHWIISRMLDLTKGQLDPQDIIALGYFMAEVDKREDPLEEEDASAQFDERPDW